MGGLLKVFGYWRLGLNGGRSGTVFKWPTLYLAERLSIEKFWSLVMRLILPDAQTSVISRLIWLTLEPSSSELLRFSISSFEFWF